MFSWMLESAKKSAKYIGEYIIYINGENSQENF